MVVVGRTILYMTQLVVVFCAASGCDKKKVARSNTTSPLSGLLSEAETPLLASSALKSAKFANCRDLLAVLRSLDLRNEPTRFDARTTTGLIEESLTAARVACPKKDQKKILIEAGTGAAESIALSLIVSDPQVALNHLASASDSAAILRRRAQLLFKVEKHQAGRDALAASLRFEEDAKTRIRVARMFTLDGDAGAALELCQGQDSARFAVPRAGAFAALGQYKDAIHQVDKSPLHLRQDVADEAARFALNPTQFANEKTASAEVLVALQIRLGPQLPDRGAELLERALLLKPDDGDLWIALATLFETTARPTDAISAWDEAAKYTPGAERPILAPIRILKDENRSREALRRATSLATAAKSSGTGAAEALRMASLGYRYAGDHQAALAYGRRSLASRPGDGRLVFELSARLEEAGKPERAVEVLSKLLVCGARGQAWHRHEVAARLSNLVGSDAINEHIGKSKITCAPVDAEDLRRHLEGTP